MIKFNLKLGAKHLNMQARFLKQLTLLSIKGMHCRKCAGVDTWLTYRETWYGESPHKIGSYLKLVFESACCQEFKERIEKKLKSG